MFDIPFLIAYSRVTPAPNSICPKGISEYLDPSTFI